VRDTRRQYINSGSRIRLCGSLREKMAFNSSGLLSLTLHLSYDHVSVALGATYSTKLYSDYALRPQLQPQVLPQRALKTLFGARLPAQHQPRMDERLMPKWWATRRRRWFVRVRYIWRVCGS
jgi:hypothetical protein